MTLKRLLIQAGCMLPLLLVTALFSFAQGRLVTGRITDSKDGSPVVNASIQIKGTQSGTSTDATGSFRINVENDNAVLVITSIGYTRQEVSVAGQAALDILLEALQGNLNEVVVVGYGTQRKKDLTGAVATVSSKDFVKGALQTPEQLIAGKVAGVQITTNSGAPGSGSRIRIRGGASLNASNDPLIVIDGVPVAGGVAGSANPLNLINPNDIENFTVLKDPSAAAIYGSRASNGVILITTKKGSRGKMKVNFSAQGFLQTASNQIDVLNADEIRSIVGTNGSQADVAKLGRSNTNWQDEIFRAAMGQDYNISMSGAIAKGKLPIRFSGGYLNQDGLLLTSNFQRLSGAVNLSPRFFNNKLKVDLNIKGARTTNRFANEGAIGSAIGFDPTQAVRTGSARYGGYWEWLQANGQPQLLATRNPVALLEMRSNNSEVLRSIGNIQFDYATPIKGLRANLNLGYDLQRGSGVDKMTDSAAAVYISRGFNNRYYSTQTNVLSDFYLNYVKDLTAINSRIDVMAGYGYQDFKFYSANILPRQFNGQIAPGANYDFLNGAPLVNNGSPGYTIISYYGRMNYTLANRYVLTLNARTDGVSRFSPDNRWGFFPSAALAWRINEENFLKNSKVVSDLKLRGGYGVTGQQDIGPLYGYIPTYSVSNALAQYQIGGFTNMLRPGAYDPDLRWETTENINVAIDFGFWDNRITGTIEGFSRKTRDLLSVVPIPALTNFSNQLFTNVGNIEYRGFEFTLNVTPIKKNDMQWDIGFNITYANPEITNLLINPDPNFTGIPVGGIAGGTGNTIQRHIVGQRPNSFFVYKQIYDKDNKPIEGLYEDINRDGIINEKDLYIYNNPEARMFGGVNSAFSYKKFSAGFVARYSLGNYIYNNLQSDRGTLRNVIDPLGFIANVSRDYLRTGFTNNQYFSDYYVRNGSFFRMDNINIGYDAGEVIKNARLRISANVQNAFIITKYNGLDPEVNGGIDNTIFPRPRTFVIGVNLDF